MSSQSSEPRKDVRLVARAPEHIQTLIKTAADMSGATVSQFLLEAATEKARQTINEMNSIKLSMQAADELFDALDNPPKMTPALEDLATLYGTMRHDYAVDGTNANTKSS